MSNPPPSVLPVACWSSDKVSSLQFGKKENRTCGFGGGMVLALLVAKCLQH